MKPYLDDGCKWCGSQEWNDELTDVDHPGDCPASVLRAIVDQWSDDYHCCMESKHKHIGRGHGKNCPLARAKALLGDQP